MDKAQSTTESSGEGISRLHTHACFPDMIGSGYGREEGTSLTEGYFAKRLEKHLNKKNPNIRSFNGVCVLYISLEAHNARFGMAALFKGGEDIVPSRSPKWPKCFRALCISRHT